MRKFYGPSGYRDMTKKQQHTPMEYCPVTGIRGAASHTDADEWRAWHGRKAWLYNPWTGKPRDPRDIGSDVTGLLIIPPNEPIYAARDKP